MEQHPKINYKQLIANNIVLLMSIYQKSRKEVCHDLDLKYTTFTDYVKGNVYPNMDVLEQLGYYFRIDVRDFFIEISNNKKLIHYLEHYAAFVGVNQTEFNHTVSEYYETPEGYPLELLEGDFYICESPTSRHQNIIIELATEINLYIKSHQLESKVFLGPFDVELPIHKDTVAVPDITVICDTNKITAKGCKGSPDWIIEVLSPNSANRNRDFVIKKNIYDKANVKEYWIVDPIQNQVHTYHLETATESYPEEPVTYSFENVIPVQTFDGFSICFSNLDLIS